MEFLIEETWSLEQIMTAFNTLFPFLRLEFISPENKTKETPFPPSDLFLFNITNSIQTLRKVKSRHHVTISPHMTVAELVEKIYSVYGLHVKVLRKSGRTWLETSRTAGWTLEKQNEVGKSLEK